MAYDGWIEFNDVDLINLSRTAQLAEVMGIDTVWTSPDSVQWIQDDLSGLGYNDVTQAPWYDGGHPASVEFAGIVPLSIPALDGSSMSRVTTEYITNGGRSGRGRNATLPIVFSVGLVASSDRGAEYGRQWMNKVLRGDDEQFMCSGSRMRFFRYAGGEAPKAHYRDVKLTRGSSITRKRRNGCSSTWLVTFTLTADDPFQYGEPLVVVTDLGGGSPTGPDIVDSGVLEITEASCPEYDYSPIYDPFHPALVPSPTAPDFYPEGWDLEPGYEFERHWVRVAAPEPTVMDSVARITVVTPEAARMVRIGVWPSDSTTSNQCGPLFMAIASYIPEDFEFVIDGESQTAYVWDGFSAAVRRADSLIYGPNASPINWVAVNDSPNLLITLDLFDLDGAGFEGDGDLRAEVALISKSD